MDRRVQQEEEEAAAKTKKGSFGSLTFKEETFKTCAAYTDTKVSLLKLRQALRRLLPAMMSVLASGSNYNLLSALETCRLCVSGTIQRYANEREILLDFFHRRLSLYGPRHRC